MTTRLTGTWPPDQKPKAKTQAESSRRTRFRSGESWRAGRALGDTLGLDEAFAEIRDPIDYELTGLTLDFQEREQWGRILLELGWRP